LYPDTFRFLHIWGWLAITNSAPRRSNRKKRRRAAKQAHSEPLKMARLRRSRSEQLKDWNGGLKTGLKRNWSTRTHHPNTSSDNWLTH